MSKELKIILIVLGSIVGAISTVVIALVALGFLTALWFFVRTAMH